jgi:hypothetical protein
MNEENTRKLFEKYEFLRPEPPIKREGEPPFIADLMNFGFECGDGWYKLIDDGCAIIQEYLKTHKGMKFKAEQIKEKWGGLRFYYSGGDENISNLISLMEHTSYQICEECGLQFDTVLSTSDETGSGGYIRTLCSDCRQKLKYVVCKW